MNKLYHPCLIVSFFQLNILIFHMMQLHSFHKSYSYLLDFLLFIMNEIVFYKLLYNLLLHRNFGKFCMWILHSTSLLNFLLVLIIYEAYLFFSILINCYYSYLFALVKTFSKTFILAYFQCSSLLTQKCI